MNADNLRPENGSEEAMRRLLNDAVADVDPRDGLDSIRGRTTVRSIHSKRPWLLGAGAAVVATAATIAAVAAIGNNPGTTTSPPPFADSPSPTEEASAVESTSPERTEPTGTQGGSPDVKPSKTATNDEAASQPQAATVPVYYIGETFRGPRLYREFHRTQASDRLVAALNAAVGRAPNGGQVTPVDPDYRSGWPGMTAVEADFDTGDPVIQVDLGGDPEGSLQERPAGMSEEQARIAVQQLVYTAQAVVQDRAPVQFLLYGERTDTLLGVPASEPVAAGEQIDTLAPIWVIDPVEGATVDSPVTVSGLANAYEANVQWELMQGDRVVKKGFTTAEGWMDKLYPYSFSVTAPPGEYTLIVHDSDASGLGQVYRDTKRITIR